MDSTGTNSRRSFEHLQYLDSHRDTTETGEELDLRKLIPILRRRLKLIVTIFAIVIISTIIITLSSMPIYQAKTKVLLALGTSRTGGGLIGGEIPLVAEYFETWDIERNLQTQIDIIKSRPIMEETSRRLGLSLIKNGKKNRNRNGKKNGNNKKNELSPERELAMNVRILSGIIGVQTNRSSNIVTLICNWPDPDVARDIVNTVSQTYIDESRKLNQEIAATARRFVEEQLIVARQELNKSDESLKKFKEKSGITNLEIEVREKVRQAAEWETQYNVMDASLRNAQARLSEVRAQISRENPSFISGSTITENPVVASQKLKLSELELKKASLMEEFGPKHPDIISINDQIKAIHSSLNKSVKEVVSSRVKSTNPVYQKLLTDYSGLQAEIFGINAALEALASKLERSRIDFSTLPAKEYTLANLERSNEVALKTYMILLEKLQNFKIAEASKLGNAQIIEPALTPEFPIKPQKLRNIAVGIVLGILLGLLGAFAMEYIDDTVKSQEDLESVTQLPMLGLVPLLKEDQLSKLFTGEKDATVATDSFRMIRANVRFFSLDRPLKTLLITSALPGEGKSTITVNLAHAFAQSDKKVLIIDSDLRNSHIHKFCKLSRTPGLTNVLVEDLSINEAIRTTGIENLEVISGGVFSPNPVELLDSQKMHQLIEQLKLRYDMIIFDTPPIGTLPDAIVLSSIMDGVLLVTSAGQTPRGALKRVVRTLAMSGARTIGAILNKLDYKKHDYYYYYYYHYNYERRGESEESSQKRQHKRHKK